MAAQDYQYSISTDFPNQKVDAYTLGEEIEASAIVTALLYVTTSGDACTVWMADVLSSGDETILDGLVAAHTGTPRIYPQNGGVSYGPIETPSAPTITPQGTPGSTTWGYKITAIGQSGETLASTEGQTTTGASTLNSTNFNRITWAAVDGAIQYGIYRATAGGTPSSTGKILDYQPAGTLQFDDRGQAASGDEPSEDRSSAVTIGSGDATPGKLLTLRELTTDDNTVTSLLTLARKSSNTVLAGFGTGIYTKLQDEDGTDRAAGSAHFLWEDPASTALEAAFRIMLREGGSQAVERFRVTPQGGIELSGNDVVSVGTCREVLAIDGGIRGGTTSGSSNNDVAAIRFDNAGDGWNRVNIGSLSRYTSGDLTFRLSCSVPSTVDANKGTRWSLDWSQRDIGDALGSWSYSNEYTYDISSQTLDTLFDIDFTITAAQFDKTKDLMFFKMTRLGTHADDDCGVHIYLHGLEVRFTGYTFCGQ
jgi:hypothetical protein